MAKSGSGSTAKKCPVEPPLSREPDSWRSNRKAPPSISGTSGFANCPEPHLRFRLDKHIQLLPDEQGPIGRRHRVDCLQHARIDAFDVVARQRFLRYDERLDANELEIKARLRIATQGRLRRRAGPE